MTTDQLGFAFGDVTATLTGNSFMHSGHGPVRDAERTDTGTAGRRTGDGHGLEQHDPRQRHGRQRRAGHDGQRAEQLVGLPTGPNTAQCDSALGTVAYTPWLTAKP